jgi:hypothetical protein
MHFVIRVALGPLGLALVMLESALGMALVAHLAVFPAQRIVDALLSRPPGGIELALRLRLHVACLLLRLIHRMLAVVHRFVDLFAGIVERVLNVIHAGLLRSNLPLPMGRRRFLLHAPCQFTSPLGGRGTDGGRRPNRRGRCRRDVSFVQPR